KVLVKEWKLLNDSKKDYYMKVHGIRSAQYKELKNEYDLLSGKSKPPSAYILYFQKKYPILKNEQKTAAETLITKMIAADWSNLSPASKEFYEEQARIEKEKRKYSEDERKNL